MNLNCIKYPMFTKNSNIKLIREIEGKTNLCSGCIYQDFKKFETIAKKQLSDFLKI